MHAISLDNVHFFYSDLCVLRNVTFTIKSGEFIGIIGPNGGGKTTLLKLLMGFLSPSKGKVEIFEKTPQKVLSKISYVPQAPRLDRLFPISVLEVVMEGLLSHLPWYGMFSKQDRQAALEALDQVGMKAFINRPFGTLSGGQAQRALIARALVSNPEIILLDEPTTGVDLNTQASLYEILKQFQGIKTILMVTHDLRSAIEIVERVLCIQNNVIELKPKEVCEHFAFGLYHPPLIQISEKSK